MIKDIHFAEPGATEWRRYYPGDAGYRAAQQVGTNCWKNLCPENDRLLSGATAAALLHQQEDAGPSGYQPRSSELKIRFPPKLFIGGRQNMQADVFQQMGRKESMRRIPDAEEGWHLYLGT